MDDVTRQEMVFSQERRWRLVKELNRHQFSISKLSDFCFTRERRRFVRRVTFAEALSECDVPDRLANSIVSAFDVSGQETIDWRAMLYMLHLVRHPDTSPSNDLKKSFQFYTGGLLDNIDAPCNYRLNFRLIEHVFRPIIRPDCMDKIMEIYNKIWINTVLQTAEDLKHHPIQEAIHTYYRKLVNDDVYVSYKKFTQVVDIMVCSTEMFEDEYYAPFLMAFKRSSRLMKNALEKMTQEVLGAAILRWKQSTQRQKSVQFKVLKILQRSKTEALFRGFDVFKRHAFNCVALVEIQSMWRGHSGRLQASSKRKKLHSIIKIQSLCRGSRDRTYCLAYIRRRNNSTNKIQRLFRGYLARIIFRKRKLTKQNQQIACIQRKLELRELYIKTLYAKRMQRIFRKKIEEKQYKELVDKRLRTLIVEREMEQRQKEVNQQHAIHKRQVLEHYHTRRKLLFENNVIQMKTRNQRQLLQKKQFFDNQANQHTKNNRRATELRQNLLDDRTSEWRKKIEVGSESHRQYCLDCLKTPETKTERQFRKHMKTIIKARMQTVLYRADERHVKIELEEAYIISEREIIEISVKSERERIENKMREDIRRLNEELDQIAHSDSLEFKKKQIKKANWILCAAVRRWIARKELNRLCMNMYEKHFDNNYEAYYYRNKRTVSLQTPVGLRFCHKIA